jgi:hypothetical protein
MDNGQQFPIPGLSLEAEKLLRYLGLHRTSDDRHLLSIQKLAQRMTTSEVAETKSLVKDMDRNERIFVAKSFAYASRNVALYRGDIRGIFHEVLIACRIAPIMSSYLGTNDYLEGTAFSHTKGIATTVRHALKFPSQHLDWNNREVLAYTHGTVLTSLANRMSETSYESVMWLGQNYQKLMPLLPLMTEVSCEREYLETLLNNDAPALWKGVL